MKKISAKKYALVLYETLSGKSHDEVKGLIRNFLELLRKQRRLSLTDKIVMEFKKHSSQKAGFEELELTSAKPLEAAGHFKSELERSLDKKIILKTLVDESLVAGAVIRHEDTVLDGSLKSQLNRLKKSLIS